MDLRRLVRAEGMVGAGAQTLLTMALVILANIATGILTARVLGPSGRGEQAAMLLWPQFLGLACTLGLPASLAYNLRRHPERTANLFWAATGLGLGAAALGVLVGYLCLPTWLARYPQPVIITARLCLVNTPVALLAALYLAVLEVRGDFGTANRARIATPLLTLALLVLLAAPDLLNPFSATLAYIGAGIPVFATIALPLWRALPPRVDLAAALEILDYARGSAGGDLLGNLGQQVDQLVILGLLSPAAMGTYVVAASLARLLNIFQAAAVRVLFACTAARPGAETLERTSYTARLTLLSSSCSGLAVIVCGPFLLALLYGPSFAEALSVLPLLVGEVVLSGTAAVLSQAFLAMGRPWTASLAQAAGLVVGIPLLILLVPRWGLVGAGLALCAAGGARLVWVIRAFPTVLGAPPPTLWPRLADLRRTESL